MCVLLTVNANVTEVVIVGRTQIAMGEFRNACVGGGKGGGRGCGGSTLNPVLSYGPWEEKSQL